MDPVVATGKALKDAGLAIKDYLKPSNLSSEIAKGGTLVKESVVAGAHVTKDYLKENGVGIAGLGLGGYGSLEFYYNMPLGIGMMVTGVGMIGAQEIYKRRRNRS